jgi:hypothetical protein
MRTHERRLRLSCTSDSSEAFLASACSAPSSALWPLVVSTLARRNASAACKNNTRGVTLHSFAPARWDVLSLPHSHLNHRGQWVLCHSRAGSPPWPVWRPVLAPPPSTTQSAAPVRLLPSRHSAPRTPRLRSAQPAPTPTSGRVLERSTYVSHQPSTGS